MRMNAVRSNGRVKNRKRNCLQHTHLSPADLPFAPLDAFIVSGRDSRCLSAYCTER